MSKRSPKELQGDTQRAVQILQLFTDPSKGRDVKMLIPPSILRDAHGIVFIRLYRIGFMLSAKSGTGIIIARLPDGSWSAPSGVSMSSVGFGHQAGGEMIDSIIVMNYRAAVKAFFDGGGQLQLGVGASLAAGPFGRAADVSASASNTTHVAATYAYSSSKGLYLGYSFEGSKISERVNTNQAYYGRPITAREILTGVVPPTQDAAKLYDMLTAMGAGPRPGLPFAPKNAKGQPLSPTATSMSSPQSSFQRPLPPLQQQGPPRTSNNQRPNNKEDYEDPPPPYQAYDSSKPLPPSSSSMNNGSSSTPCTSPQQKNGAVMPPPINDSRRPVMNNGQSTYNNKAESSQFSRQNINQAAVNIHNTGNAQGLGPASSSSYSNTGPWSPTHNSSFAAAGPSNGFAGPSSSSTQPPPMNANANTMPLSGPPQSSTDVKKPIMDEPRTNSLTVVVAKYDYTGDQPADLSFHAGDHIIVTKRLDDRQSWWEGEIGDRRGFFPANYTDELEE
ncbi:C-8 sterol isomerase [Mucor velutinosus]|uniref:C-8 sterol isomerase n=1 Tax=Mucor velutinosus TaxID=708070 RepID=A0AAN7DCL8_9FUNG|nr:C-8 sterol isomerase [Mucor velutinosus]